jgi:DNA-binding winged helix-turn-helix (wHTH) protein
VKIRFERFTLDSDTRQLFRDNREIHLSPKAFSLLCTLLEARPNVVEKRELHARIWPGTFVVDANLNVLIGEIRRALSDDAQRPRWVRTVHGVGYAFCGSATDVAAAPSISPATTGSAKFWLVCNDRTFVLLEGENIIGRDPQCGVWLDSSGVSRQHACVHINNSTLHASLEDLESTNGTFLRGSRVTAREALTDNDLIQVGSVELTFRVWSADKPARTERIRRAGG